MRAPSIEVIGVPSSAGAHWPGQEKAPAALREAGLVEALSSYGWDVVDHGDPAVTRWQPVKENGVSNASTTASVARQTADRVHGAIAAGHFPLVLGGDCSITVGVLAGLHETDPGLLYFDGGFDIGNLAKNPRGILDSMGLAHALGDPDTYEPLARVGSRYPLLTQDALLGFGVNSDDAQTDYLAHRGIRGITATQLRTATTPPRSAAPVRREGGEGKAAEAPTHREGGQGGGGSAGAVGLAGEARGVMEGRERTFLVHFDVDVIDFFDLPLADVPVHVDDHAGLPFGMTMDCLDVFMASPLLAGLVVTELNPDHCAPADVRRFVLRLAESLAAAIPTRTVPTRTGSRRVGVEAS
jgi:arginase